MPVVQTPLFGGGNVWVGATYCCGGIMPGCCGPGGITGCTHAGFSPPGGYAWAMVQMLPQEKVVRCLVQASKQSSKQASIHACMQLPATYNWDSLEAPQYKAMKLLPLLLLPPPPPLPLPPPQYPVEHDRRYATMRNRKCSSSSKRFAHTCFFFFFFFFDYFYWI